MSAALNRVIDQLIETERSRDREAILAGVEAEHGPGFGALVREKWRLLVAKGQVRMATKGRAAFPGGPTQRPANEA